MALSFDRTEVKVVGQETPTVGALYAALDFLRTLEREEAISPVYFLDLGEIIDQCEMALQEERG